MGAVRTRFPFLGQMEDEAVESIGKRLVLRVCLVIAFPSVVWGGAHTWDVNELFSNADGTIQFIELREANGTPNELGVPGKVMHSTGSADFTIVGDALESPSTNKHYLIATQTFADLPGAPTPDAIIPAGLLPFWFGADGGTVTYHIYHSLTYGAGELPTDGINSINEPSNTIAVNSPTNYAGDTGSVDVSSPEGCPNACGDIDGGGGTVNLADFATFAVCFGGSPSVSTGCQCSDMNDDGVINLLDFATFTFVFGASSTNSIPDCP